MNDGRVRGSVSISIVIPAHNEQRHLAGCLDAIAAQTVRPYEVIVADNNSTDNTVDLVRAYPFVKVVHESRQGRVFARNRGFDAATGDVIGRIDADTILPADWVEHVQRFYADPRRGDQAWTGGPYFYNVPMPRLVNFASALLAFHFNKLLIGHYSLWGSTMALTQQQWRAVRSTVCKRNDIHEDLDLTMHLAAHGYGITYDRSVKVRAEMRRIHTGRHELWEYLNWWPRTLRVHGRRAWPVCWFFGAFGLYVATYILIFADKMKILTRKQPGRRQVSAKFDSVE